MKKTTRFLLNLLSLLASAVVAVPLYFILINSFKSKADAAQLNLSLPREWAAWDNYRQVFVSAQIPMAFMNTLILTVFGVLLILLFCSLSAYVIQRRNSRFTRALTQVIVAGLILPSSIITTYYMMDTLSLVRTYSGVILLFVAGNYALVTYLYIAFFGGVPKELDEAAIIDGAGKYRLFFAIILPLLQPINATVLVLASMNIWNDFLTPFYFLNTSGRYTLSLVVYLFFGQRAADWNLVFSVIVLVSSPVIILYLLMQRFIVSGMTSGAVKS